MNKLGVLLRFRDLVTEPGGNISEHRKIINQRGHVWWGWWARQSEIVPRSEFNNLFAFDNNRTKFYLFDTGEVKLYETVATNIVVAPSIAGISSPEPEATPSYYVRGRYPAWFKFISDIKDTDIDYVTVHSRPTMIESEDNKLKVIRGYNLRELDDDRATLWIIKIND